MNDLITLNCVSVTFPSILNCKSEPVLKLFVSRTFNSVGSEKLNPDGDTVDGTFRGVVDGTFRGVVDGTFRGVVDGTFRGVVDGTV